MYCIRALLAVLRIEVIPAILLYVHCYVVCRKMFTIICESLAKWGGRNFHECLPEGTILKGPQTLSTNRIIRRTLFVAHNVQLVKRNYCLIAS